MLLRNLISAITIVAVCITVSPVSGQTSSSIADDAATVSTTLSADGLLIGNVRTPTTDAVPNAKISLVSDGKVIDLAVSDESGSFSFSDVNPSHYQIVGSADSLIGAQACDVCAYDESVSANPVNLTLCPCSCETVGSAPLATYSTAPVAQSGGFGRGIGSGLIRNPRRLLLAGALAGGIVAIADDDGVDDASPDF